MDCDERSQSIYADHVRVDTRMSDHVALAIRLDKQTTHKAPLDCELQRYTTKIPTCRTTEATGAVARVASADHCVQRRPTAQRCLQRARTRRSIPHRREGKAVPPKLHAMRRHQTSGLTRLTMHGDVRQSILKKNRLFQGWECAAYNGRAQLKGYPHVLPFRTCRCHCLSDVSPFLLAFIFCGGKGVHCA